MPDLSQALVVLRSMRSSMSPEVLALGTGWGHGNTLAAKCVPVVPDVPAQNEAQLGLRGKVCLHDVLERAAILEFCEGLPRKEADVRAITEFDLTSWEALTPTLGHVADWRAYLRRPQDG
jgi:hypothetical protein